MHIAVLGIGKHENKASGRHFLWSVVMAIGVDVWAGSSGREIWVEVLEEW